MKLLLITLAISGTSTAATYTKQEFNVAMQETSKEVASLISSNRDKYQGKTELVLTPLEEELIVKLWKCRKKQE
jgi:hypothetical protein